MSKSPCHMGRMKINMPNIHMLAGTKQDRETDPEKMLRKQF
jgi:hypothetical protein